MLRGRTGYDCGRRLRRSHASGVQASKTVPVGIDRLEDKSPSGESSRSSKASSAPLRLSDNPESTDVPASLSSDWALSNHRQPVLEWVEVQRTHFWMGLSLRSR